MSNPTELPELDRLKAEHEAFEEWARNHLGQGYPLTMDEHVYEHPVTRWAFKAWKASADRRAQPEGEAPQAKDTPESMAQSNARFSIDGAIQYGRENRNEPPGTDHWLYEYWNIGRQLAQLGATGWDNVTPTPAATLSPLCGAQHAESGKEVAGQRDIALDLIHYESEDGHTLVRLDKVKELLAAQQAAASGLLNYLRDGYASGFFASGPDDGDHRFTLHYDTAEQAEEAFMAVTSAIESSAPGTPEAPTDAGIPASPDLNKRMADALNVTLWLYRRLPSAYGRPPFVDAALLEMAKIADIDAQGSIAERAAQLDGGQEGSA